MDAYQRADAFHHGEQIDNVIFRERLAALVAHGIIALQNLDTDFPAEMAQQKIPSKRIRRKDRVNRISKSKREKNTGSILFFYQNWKKKGQKETASLYCALPFQREAVVFREVRLDTGPQVLWIETPIIDRFYIERPKKKV